MTAMQEVRGGHSMLGWSADTVNSAAITNTTIKLITISCCLFDSTAGLQVCSPSQGGWLEQKNKTSITKCPIMYIEMFGVFFFNPELMYVLVLRQICEIQNVSVSPVCDFPFYL